VRSVVGRIHHESIVGDAQLVEQVEHLADVLVVVDHRVVVGKLPATRLAKTFRFGVREQMHVGCVEPYKEGFVRLVRSLDKVYG